MIFADHRRPGHSSWPTTLALVIWVFLVGLVAAWHQASTEAGGLSAAEETTAMEADSRSASEIPESLSQTS